MDGESSGVAPPPQNTETIVGIISQFVQSLSVIIGVVISVLSFNSARNQESEARQKEADTRLFELKKYHDSRLDEERKQQVEAAHPFLLIRQKYYLEAIQTAAILSNSDPDLRKSGEFELSVP